MKTTKLFFFFLLISGINLSFSQTNKVDSISAKEIIKKYINAIGGRDGLLKVKDMTTKLQGTISGVDVNMTVYQKSPDKILKIINAGAVKQVILYDGSNAVMQIGETKITLSDQALEGLKYETLPNFLLNLDELNIKAEILSNEIIEGRDTYKIKLILPSGEYWTYFFDAKTFLKVKSLKTIYSPQGSFTQSTYFSDYRLINGVKYPFIIKQTIGIQSLDFKVVSIKVNSGIKDEVFKIE